MRGRLIFPFMVEIAQLDTDATAADPDGTAGPLVGGYDDVFREPVVVPQATDDRTGTTRRVENFIQLPAQVHPDAFNELQQLFSGANPNTVVECWFHYADLERLHMVDSETGQPLLQHNDRLAAIYDMDGGLVQTIPERPGLYATQVQSRGYSFGRRRNLLVVTFQEREQGARA